MPQIANLRAIADVGVKNIELDRHRHPRGAPRAHSCPLLGRRPAARGVRPRVLSIVEIDADDRIAARITFDPDDIDAAFAELDARYLAGEAAAHAHTWSVIARAYAAFNRRELPATTPDWVEHRPPASDSVRARRHGRIHPCHVGRRAGHQVLHRGRASAERPRSGRHPSVGVDLARGLRRRVAGDQPLHVEGDLFNRCELFDEADLDAALARFDELSRPRRGSKTRRPARGRVSPTRSTAATWTTFVDLTSPDGTFDDRRKGLRDSQDASMRRRVTQTLFEFPRSWRMDLEHVAIRGSKLGLSRQTLRDSDEADRTDHA